MHTHTISSLSLKEHSERRGGGLDSPRVVESFMMMSNQATENPHVHRDQ